MLSRWAVFSHHPFSSFSTPVGITKLSIIDVLKAFLHIVFNSEFSKTDSFNIWTCGGIEILDNKQPKNDFLSINRTSESQGKVTDLNFSFNLNEFSEILVIMNSVDS